MRKKGRPIKRICIQKGNLIARSALALILSLSLVLLGSPAAYGVTGQDISSAEHAVADAESLLNEAQEKLDRIAEEYNALNAEIDELQAEIDELATQVLEAQAAMLEGRSALSDTAKYQYQSGTISTFLDALLGANDWSELMRNMDYISTIASHQSEEVQAQQELRDRFSEASDKLTTQKDEQEAKLGELAEKRKEATAVVEEASSLVDENSAKLKELKQQAQSFIWTSPEEPAEDNGSTTPPEQNNGNNTNSGNNTNPTPPPSTVGSEWRKGTASAYGGSSDPYTPNPGTTATGAVCDDYSMGVAIPMSMPNYRSYFGKTVEINYNGMTVYATVNDCGHMGGGSRVLDLQPGVFKAFGFKDCQSWGLRTVTYRFL